jgi:pyrroline-5-carboxylate reductase
MVIGFIGAGVMARALGRGLVESGLVSASGLLCSAPTREEGQPFLDLFPGSRWTSDNAEVVRASDLVILAVKPQVLPAALPPLREAGANKLFLSIAAGVTIEKIRGWLDPSARVIRAMPNTPMQIGLGASVYAGDPKLPADDYALVDRVLSSAGKAWRVEEAQIDAVTALSGSGPAYVFHFIDALLRGGIALGLPEELSRALALQTVLGSAQLAAQSPLSPLDLAAQVKSPRGTTLAGCAVLEENGAFNTLISAAMAAAHQRAGQLARGEN